MESSEHMRFRMKRTPTLAVLPNSFPIGQVLSVCGGPQKTYQASSRSMGHESDSDRLPQARRRPLRVRKIEFSLDELDEDAGFSPDTNST